MPVKTTWSFYKVSLENLIKDVKKLSIVTDNLVQDTDTDQIYN